MSSDEKSQHKRGSGFAIGTLIGITAGAVAGLLFAPKSGKETRSDLKDKAQELEAETKEKTETAKRKARSAKREAEATGERVRRKIEDARTDDGRDDE